MLKSRPIITLTSDFGTKDGYTGQIKGVISSICPEAKVIDISNEIEPFNLSSAAWTITSAYKYFPKGTIHLVVVDPQVGSKQRKILLESASETFIGPDNGIFSLLLAERSDFKAYEIDKKDYWMAFVSTSFHTRDIFAPVAAHLASGVKACELATEIPLESLNNLPGHALTQEETSVTGSVIHIDRFGNLITNIPRERIRHNAQCFLEEVQIGQIKNTYSSVKVQEATAFTGSHGYLEIAVNQGNACEKFQAKTGTKVRLNFTKQEAINLT
jgi:S-adenosylmethionine hydrolase